MQEDHNASCELYNTWTVVPCKNCNAEEINRSYRCYNIGDRAVVVFGLTGINPRATSKSEILRKEIY